MLVSLEGRMGQGKTLSMTGLAVLEHKRNGKKLFSTYHLSSVIDCPYCGLRHPISRETAELPYNYICSVKEETFEVTEKDHEDGRIIEIEYTYLTAEAFYDIFKMADQGQEVLSNCLFLLDEAYLFLDARTSGSKMNRIFNSFAFQTRKRGVDLYISTHDVARLDKRIRAAIDLRISCRFIPSQQSVKLRIRDVHTGARKSLKFYGPKFWAFYNTNEMVRPQGKLYTVKPGDLS